MKALALSNRTATGCHAIEAKSTISTLGVTSIPMLMRIPSRFTALAMFLGLGACAGSTPPLQSTPTLTVVSDSKLPPPPGIDVNSSERPYLIGPFDQLRIDVFGIAELSDRRVQVDAGGNVSFPLVGTIHAVGQTPNALAARMASLLAARYVRDPQVTVNVEETVSQVVTVDGQVARPGLYPVLGHMTLARAVATAGGAGEFAKLSDIVILRTVGDKRYAALYDLSAIRRGQYEDPEIYANDIIVVGDSPQRRMFRDIVQVAPLAIAPLVAVLQN